MNHNQIDVPKHLQTPNHQPSPPQPETHLCLLSAASAKLGDRASCGTTRITIPTGPVLSAAIQPLPPPSPTPPPQETVSSSTFLLVLELGMMESICLDDSGDSDADPGWDFVDEHPGPRTPSTISDDPEVVASQPQYQQDASDGSDDDYGGPGQTAPKRKKGGYDSRIEQILYENPDLPILITDAGKSVESGGKYIVYTIRTGVCYISAVLKFY